MVNFSLGFNPHNNNITFASYPQREEWTLLCHLFSGSIDLDYFKQLRTELTALEQDSSLKWKESLVDIPSPNGWLIGEVQLNAFGSIDVIDRRDNQKVIVSIAEFKQLITRWIHFVESNTKTFAQPTTAVIPKTAEPALHTKKKRR
jgi:hypothetical protein